jgi:hypothetical protein
MRYEKRGTIDPWEERGGVFGKKGGKAEHEVVLMWAIG